MAIVYIRQYSGEAARQYLIERGYELIERSDKVCDTDALSVCDGIVARAVPLIGEEDLKKAPHLKVIGRYGVGVDNIDVEACTRHGVQVTNAPLSNYISVAEHAWMFIMECAKNVTEVNELFRGERHYFNARNTNSGHDLFGKTVGILGLGRIGRRLAQMASGFEMNIIAYDPYVSQEQAPENVCMVQSREMLFAASDIISLHIPCTKETAGSINRECFRQMKKGVYLINTCRGGVINEEDLAEALRDGTVAAAGLDVLREEPPAPDNPLLKMDQVFVTSHMGAESAEAGYRSQMIMADTIERFLDKGELSRFVQNRGI